MQLPGLGRFWLGISMQPVMVNRRQSVMLTFLAAFSDLVTESDLERLHTRLNSVLQFVVGYRYLFI